jgi:hypothetical protein
LVMPSSSSAGGSMGATVGYEGAVAVIEPDNRESSGEALAHGGELE